MTEINTFGFAEPQAQYTERRAAYVVVFNKEGRVAMVRGREKHFLPGGGSEPFEAPEETINREVREELARGVRLICPLGEATQYFYSAADDRHYRMRALFFRGEFTEEPCTGEGEHEMEWLPVEEAERFCFHASHAWAISRA